MPLKLRNYIKIVLTVLTFSLPLLLPATSFAASAIPNNCNSNIANNINAGIDGAAGGSGGCGSNTGITSGITSLATKAVNILSVIVGVVAIIMIIFGGFKYITSGGESGNVSGAKNTLIYAIVGLVIVALAQIIVHWVLNSASTITVSGLIHL